MLNLVQTESERIDSRFLEPACGSGNFLVPILRRKLHTVDLRHGRSDFEKLHYALFALMCVYGIELLNDNVRECQRSLLHTFADYLQLDREDTPYRAATFVLQSNIKQGDALTMTSIDGRPIIFPEWAYLGKGKYQRRDFQYDTLMLRPSAGTLLEALDENDLVSPIKSYSSMTIDEIAA